MDNDQLRRGQPTCHVVYGEAIAVLAGDLLLNRAAELMFDQQDPGYPGTKAAAQIIMRAAGEKGMIGGQVLDLQSESRSIGLDALRQMHRLKTGALLLAPLLAALALIKPAAERTHLHDRSAADWDKIHQSLLQYGESIGLAFQIRDDILDVSSTSVKLGKSVGKDARDMKSTYVTLLGQEMAADQLRRTLETAGQAVMNLEAFNLDTIFLSGLVDYLLVRES
jgi:geranylgeranyl diphosphate synthase type II